MVEFVHLRVHSDYSLAEGASKVEDIVEAAKAAGMPALALTDKNNLYGAMDFSKQASGAGVQPIIGCQLYFEFDKGKRGSFTLLAQNETGYQNLCAVLRAAHDPRPQPDGTVKPPAHPAVDLDTLEARAEGIIFLTGGGADGLLPQLAERDPAQARELYQWLLSVYGDRLYVEICRNQDPDTRQAAVEDALIELAYGGAGPVACADGVERAEAPLVGTVDVWYATPDRHDAWTLIKAVESKSTITIDGDRIVNGSSLPCHLRPEAEAAALFTDLPEAVTNTVNIARRCAYMVKGRKPVLPPFDCGEGRTEDDELRHQAREGLNARFEHLEIPAERHQEYIDRLEFELDVILKMGFPGYFLIVSDFIKWSKANDIPVGPGRGSGAGSVVAWALTITDLDPLRFGLLFERFLNPERVSMPDFDVDFCQDGRERVVEYVRNKYGSDLVSMIATFGEIKSKTALKDAGRVIIHEQLGTFGYGDINDLTKLIPENPADQKELQATYEEMVEFRDRIDSSPKLKVLFERAKQIEGLYRQVGQHAAGIVIGDRPLHEYVPIMWDPKAGMPVCGFNMKNAEYAGMVKFDFLGLKTLSVINLCLKYIKKTRGRDIDLAKVPLDIPEVYDRIFVPCNTTGVFQFESAVARKALRPIRAKRFEDIIAVNALNRPGPADNIPLYAQRNNHEVETEYPAPVEKTRPILEETCGIMIYQEQVQMIARAVAGYSLGAADLLRRAMGKKDPKEMARQRQIFIHGDGKAIPGAVAQGITEDEAASLFDDMEKFAGYGFNKSHAAAYALIAYHTAYLKTFFPVEFFSALMSYETDKPEKLALIKEDLDAMKVALLPPDVNASFARFTSEAVANGGHDGFAVRFGLTAIKGISGDLAFLVEDREANGPFTSLEDFYRRVGGHFNKGQLERLAEAGAFDGLARSRFQAANVLGWLAEHKEKKPTNQLDMFGGAAAIVVPQKILDVPEWGNVADREYKAVGFYFSRHPIDPYVPRLLRAGVRRRMSFCQWMKDNGQANLEERKLCAMVDDVRVKQNKRGSTYVEAWVSERGDAYRISLYENWRQQITIEDFRRILEGAKACRKPVVFVCGLALDRQGSGVWVNGRDVWDIDAFLADLRGDIEIRLDRERMHLNREESKRLQAIDEAAKAGSLTPQAAAAERGKLWAEAAERKIAEIAALIEKQGRSDDKEAVPVRLGYGSDLRALPGRYRFTPLLESMLKQTDGVVSITETVTGGAQPAAPSATPAALPPLARRA